MLRGITIRSLGLKMENKVNEQVVSRVPTVSFLSKSRFRLLFRALRDGLMKVNLPKSLSKRWFLTGRARQKLGGGER